MEKIAVIALGNTLRKDDAVGIVLRKKLGKRIEIIDGGTGALKLIDVLSRYDRIILLDAIDFGGAPGDLKIFDLEDVDGENLFSTHSFDIKKLVELSKILYDKPREVVIVGIQPKDMSYGLDLSQEIRNKMDKISEKMIKILEGMI